MTKSHRKVDPGSPERPVVFGKYFLCGLIARGGMAEVYRARLIEPEGQPRLLAIKVMRPSLAMERRFIDMFHSEGQLALLLTNRSIVKTVELGEIAHQHYIAMEYLAGEDLVQVLRKCQEQNQRLPIAHAVFIATRIVEALAFAHKLTDEGGRPLNIVNRDVSPSNVRITYDGGIRILDFGIAQALMKFTSEIGILKGKFSYMSPEQIRGMPLDARSDVFSAGIILHEMLSTEKLFRGDTEFALMENVRKAEVQPPSNFNPNVTQRLDEIALKALARDVADRYQSAAEMLVELLEVLATFEIEDNALGALMHRFFEKERADEERQCEIALYAFPDDEDDLELDTQRETPPLRFDPSPSANEEHERVSSTEVRPSSTVDGKNKRSKDDDVGDDDQTRGDWSSRRRRQS